MRRLLRCNFDCEKFIAQIERFIAHSWEFIAHLEPFIAQSGDLSLKLVSAPSSLIETTTSHKKRVTKALHDFSNLRAFE
jgi:hypothetical protein